MISTTTDAPNYDSQLREGDGPFTAEGSPAPSAYDEYDEYESSNESTDNNEKTSTGIDTIETTDSSLFGSDRLTDEKKSSSSQTVTESSGLSTAFNTSSPTRTSTEILMNDSESSKPPTPSATSLSVRSVTSQLVETSLGQLNPLFILLCCCGLLLSLAGILTLVFYVRKLLCAIRNRRRIQEVSKRGTVNPNEQSEVPIEEPAGNSGGFTTPIPLVPILLRSPSRKNSISVSLQ